MSSRFGEHRHQEIVEVVRHSAGELADRFHLLRVAKLLLCPFPLTDSASTSLCASCSSRVRVRHAFLEHLVEMPLLFFGLQALVMSAETPTSLIAARCGPGEVARGFQRRGQSRQARRVR